LVNHDFTIMVVSLGLGDADVPGPV